MSAAPKGHPHQYKYSEIDINESWREVRYDDEKYKLYRVIITASKTPIIVLQDKKGDEKKICFVMSATVLLEGDDIMWYNKSHTMKCP